MFARLISFLLVGVYLLAIGVYFFYKGDGTVNTFWHNALYLLASLMPVLAGVWATVTYGLETKHGRSMLFLTVGVGLLCLGEISWVYFEFITNTDPFPSVADIMYLLAYPFLLLGLIEEIRAIGRDEKVNMSSFVKFILYVLGSILVVMVAYFGIYLAYDGEAALIENLVSIAYGVADLVLVFAGAFVLRLVSEYRGGRLFRSWVTFLAGLSMFLIADILFAEYYDQYENFEYLYRQIDILWMGAYTAYALSFVSIVTVLHDVRKRVLDSV